MPKTNPVEMIDVNAGNVSDAGFFCMMSKRKCDGYKNKLRWLEARFAEGMKIKILKLPVRGFIEYIPGEYAWRAIDASGYMVIHCLWVVGKSKGKGYAGLLLEQCIADALSAGMKGVAIVTSKGNWLMDKKILLRHGFELTDQAPPAFELMVKKFKKASSPKFVGGWDEKARRCGKGFTILTSGQCPYHGDAVRFFTETAKEIRIPCKVVDISSSQQVRAVAPYAYGTFNVVYNGKPFSYHYLLKKDIVKRLAQLDK